jgi:predicted CXXCH cytochrome family protein
MCLLPLLTVSLVVLARPRGENVHRPDANCGACHTADRDTLERDPIAARAALVPDLEERCARCHDEGPSHRTDIPPRKAVPDTLPLSVGGTITCSTCHFVHGEQNPFGDFLRIDNSRGALCLTCHELSELQ